ncbi:MAG: hypothetical protein ACT4OJ_08820 [Bacteroidota bacterium]
MALDKTRLKNNLKNVFTDTAANGGVDRDAQLDYFCEKLADELVEEIKRLTITYNNGLAAGATPVTGVFNNTLT